MSWVTPSFAQRIIAAFIGLQRDFAAHDVIGLSKAPPRQALFVSLKMAQPMLYLAVVVKRNVRRDTDLPKSFDPQMDQHEIFEIDRSNLVLQLRTIRRAINESAEEMEMVAIERVFVKAVSRVLTRTARKLYHVAEDLADLHRLIERARLPGALMDQIRSRSPAIGRSARVNLYLSFSGSLRLVLDSGVGSLSNCGSVPNSRRLSQFCFFDTQMWSAARAGMSPSSSPVGIATTGFPAKTAGTGEPHFLQNDLRYAGGSRRIGASKNESSSAPRSQRNFSARTRNSAANGEPVAR